MTTFEILVQHAGTGFMDFTVRAFEVPIVLMFLNTVFGSFEHTFRLWCRCVRLVVRLVRYRIRIGSVVLFTPVNWLSF